MLSNRAFGRRVVGRNSSPIRTAYEGIFVYTLLKLYTYANIINKVAREAPVVTPDSDSVVYD